MGGGGEIGSQIIEFFELEEPWKVEKGPGGHERKRKKKTIWHSLQGFLSKACGKTRISAFFWGWGGRLCIDFMLGGDTAYMCLGRWVGEMLGMSVLGEHAT